MTDKILLVDDDENILQGYRRQLRKHFEITTALGGPAALEELKSAGPFPVIVTDMQMPEMNGLQFLNAAYKVSPNSVRIMLTGNADQKTAVDAVNDGQVFRFLTKPCSSEDMFNALRAAVEQYRIQQIEKELLSKTLGGSVSVMTEVLSLVNSAAFGHTGQLRDLTQLICKSLQLKNTWEIEVAAMLSQTGCITVPERILERYSAGFDLTDEEEATYKKHPLVGYNLVLKIPRLQNVAKIIKYQLHSYQSNDTEEAKDIPFGARVLKIVNDTVRIRARTRTRDEVLAKLQARADQYAPELLELLEKLLQDEYEIVHVNVDEVEVGMLLDEDVMSASNQLLLSKGHELTVSTLIRLRGFAQSALGVKVPFRVLRPRAKIVEAKGGSKTLAAAN